MLLKGNSAVLVTKFLQIGASSEIGVLLSDEAVYLALIKSMLFYMLY